MMLGLPASVPDGSGMHTRGLASAASDLANVTDELFLEMCLDVLLFLRYQKPEVDTNQISQKLEAENINISTKALKRMVNALCFHYRDASNKKLSTDAFSESLQSLRLYSEEKVKIMTRCWEEQKMLSTQADLMEHLSVGQLLDMDWKLSMAMNSSSCKNLHAPTITLMIKVLQPNGDIVKRSFELTLDQFQNLSKQLEDTKSVLETV